MSNCIHNSSFHEEDPDPQKFDETRLDEYDENMDTNLIYRKFESYVKSVKFQEQLAEVDPMLLLDIEDFVHDKVKQKYKHVFNSKQLGLI